MRQNLKNISMGKFVSNIALVLLGLLVLSCKKGENTDETKMKDLDPKYLSESQLFALNQAIADDPDEPENYYLRAKVYVERNENNKALPNIARAINLKANEGKYYYLKSLIFNNLNNTDSSLVAAHTAESYNLHNTELKVLLARLHLEKRDLVQADKYLQQALTLTPDHPGVFFIQGKTLTIQGDTTKAVGFFHKAIHRDTNHADSYRELSQIFFNKHKYDSALVFVASGKIADPEDAFFNFLEGRVLEQLKYTNAARAFYYNALQKDSMYAPAYHALGMLNYKEAKTDAARLNFEKELKISPTNLETSLLLAEIYQNTNVGYQAISLLERVLKADTTNKKVKASLEKLYEAYPDRKPKPEEIAKVDSIAQQGTLPKQEGFKTDSVKKTIPPPVVKKDTAKKNVAPKPKEKTNFIPKIINPDSSKIEIRKKDSL